jgi:hypothetical protein
MSTPDESSGSGRRWLMAVVMVPLAVALIGAVATVASALMGGSEGDPPQIDQTVVTSVPTATAPSTVTSPPDTPDSHLLPGQRYVLDMDYKTDMDHVQTGVALIGGQQYQKSFRFDCVDPIITIPLRGGESKISGAIGWSDEGEKGTDLTLNIEATAGMLDGNEWTRIAIVELSGSEAKQFSTPIPPGSRGLRLSTELSCGSEFVLADPVVQ